MAMTRILIRIKTPTPGLHCSFSKARRLTDIGDSSHWAQIGCSADCHVIN